MQTLSKIFTQKIRVIFIIILLVTAIGGIIYYLYDYYSPGNRLIRAIELIDFSNSTPSYNMNLTADIAPGLGSFLSFSLDFDGKIAASDKGLYLESILKLGNSYQPTNVDDIYKYILFEKKIYQRNGRPDWTINDIDDDSETLEKITDEQNIQIRNTFYQFIRENSKILKSKDGKVQIELVLNDDKLLQLSEQIAIITDSKEEYDTTFEETTIVTEDLVVLFLIEEQTQKIEEITISGSINFKSTNEKNNFEFGIENILIKLNKISDINIPKMVQEAEEEQEESQEYDGYDENDGEGDEESYNLLDTEFYIDTN